MQDILSTPYPKGVCALPIKRRTGLQTLWSWTAALGMHEIAFAPGSPIEAAYRLHALSESD